MKMVEPLDSKNIIKHIANGQLGELCLLCLVPLYENCFESIFTLICREDTEYCVADAVAAVCQFQFNTSDNYNVCIDCFKSASEAYKFHLKAKRSIEVITHYTQELLNNVNNIEITSKDLEKLLFIPITEYTPTTSLFEFNIEGAGKSVDENITAIESIADGGGIGDNINTSENHTDDDKDYNIHINDMNNSIDSDFNKTIEMATTYSNLHITGDKPNLIVDNNKIAEDNLVEDHLKKSEGNIILVVQKEETIEENQSNVLMQSSDDEMLVIINEKKVRKKRDPMMYMSCSQCPVKYRFVAKLKEHMKTAHDIDLFYCKICKIITERKEEYEEHLKSHTVHQCPICNVVYKKADTLTTHMKSHEKQQQIQQFENANVCEQCGAILESEASLEEHVLRKHVKRYTCFYCGRRYRNESSFEAHVKKHEDYWDKQRSQPEGASKQTEKQADKHDKSKRAVCQTCGKDFVDERSLLWHMRLHNNDRPYSCDLCGRGFVSKNRRNQHSLCAHTQPQRRCPLCPALFHLRSMVNSHVKKVHLKAHKRRNRSSKHGAVHWRTAPVAVQDLSVELQQHVLDLQARAAS